MAETSVAPKTTRKRNAPKAPAVSGTDDAASAKTSTVDKVKAQASSMASEATDAARKAASTGKDKAVEALDGVAKLAEDAAKAVDEHLGATYGNYARKASETVSKAATSLQSKEIDDLIEDTKAFVRKSPVVAIGAAAAVGFLLTRLIRIGGGSDRS